VAYCWRSLNSRVFSRSPIPLIRLTLTSILGITVYLKGGGTLENTQLIAVHESPRTTNLYDRRSDDISLDEIERIII